MSRKILLISLFLFSLDNNFAEGGQFWIGDYFGRAYRIKLQVME